MEQKIVNNLSSDMKKSMRTRIITGLVMAVILIPCVLIGGYVFLGLATLIAGFGVYEILHVTGKKYPLLIWILAYAFTYALIGWMFLANEGDLLSVTRIHLSTVLTSLLIGILFAYAVISDKIDVHDVTYITTTVIFISLAVQSVLFLRYVPETTYTYSNKLASSLLFIYVVLAVVFNDIFAYFVGVLFGKHKMNERVSPKKSWEGFFGGVIISTISTIVFALVCDKSFNVPLIDGLIDGDHIGYVIILSLSLSLTGVIGDLMFSLIKRAFNIKDYGFIFPGHGGVLDRFDSLLFSCLFASCIIMMFTLPLGVL